jgi:hypothetical protein
MQSRIILHRRAARQELQIFYRRKKVHSGMLHRYVEMHPKIITPMDLGLTALSTTPATPEHLPINHGNVSPDCKEIMGIQDTVKHIPEVLKRMPRHVSINDELENLKGPGDNLRALASDFIRERPHRTLPARRRVADRTSIRKNLPFVHVPTPDKFVLPKTAPDYHPAPFTPAHVPAMYTCTSPEKQYGCMFNRAETKSCEPAVHWRDGLLSLDNPACRKESAIRSSIGVATGDRRFAPTSHVGNTWQAPDELLSVASDGTEKLCSKSALDLRTLATWLDDSRPINHSGAYSMLLLAKDLIRRLLSASVVVWNEAEDNLRQELAAAEARLRFY